MIGCHDVRLCIFLALSDASNYVCVYQINEEHNAVGETAFSRNLVNSGNRSCTDVISHTHVAAPERFHFTIRARCERQDADVRSGSILIWRALAWGSTVPQTVRRLTLDGHHNRNGFLRYE